MSAPRPTVSSSYDVIIVGARCAGAATAMLLAQQGRRVLVMDRVAEGADTVSTHALMRVGIVQLQRWGLLDDLISAGTPPISQILFRYGNRTELVELGDRESDALRAPRRTVLDPILVNAARRAGAEFRFGTTVNKLIRDPRTNRVVGIEGQDRDGTQIRVRAPLTIGADGVRSRVARDVGARIYRQARSSSAFIYSYWSDVEATGYEWCYGDRCVAGLIPTNGHQVGAFIGIPHQEFDRAAMQTAGAEDWFLRRFSAAAPAIAHRLPQGARRSRFSVFTGLPGYFRQAHGPGWALVGDAGYFKDPITAHGISDALRDAAPNRRP